MENTIQKKQVGGTLEGTEEKNKDEKQEETNQRNPRIKKFQPSISLKSRTRIRIECEA